MVCGMTKYDYVLGQLAARRGEWPAIARRSSVGYQWMTKLMAGKFADPGVHKIERLYAVLRADSQEAA